MPRAAILVCLALPFPAVCQNQNLGTPPALTVDATNLYTAFSLPPLRDTQQGGLAGVLSSTQVGSRATTLGLNGQSALNAWSAAGGLLQSLAASSATTTLSCLASTPADINRQLAAGCKSLTVTAKILTLDRPIEIQESGVTLDFGAIQVSAMGAAAPYAVRIENANSVTLRGGRFVSGTAGILVNASQKVQVEGVELSGLSSDAIVVTGSSNVVVTDNHIHGVQGAGIVVHRGTTGSAVLRNDVESNLGFSNMTAGILITDREVNLASNPAAIFGPDGYWVVTQPITSRLHPPNNNVIAFNRVTQNLSSGVYVDGAVQNIIVSNVILGNAKEGLCLDNGSTANVVAANVFEQNGDRWGQPDWVLTEDSVLSSGRLPDGTAAAKTPGISLDNAMYNQVFQNSVSHNFGGGIKVVRTGFFNLIGLNTLFSNNDGASAFFHFFGVELGAAAADSPSAELDFTPSQGNVVFSNPIRGNHYSGIFFDAGSDQNDIIANTIMDALQWGLESVEVMNNNTLNNLTTLPSRNVGSGLSPTLVTSGQPVLEGN